MELDFPRIIKKKNGGTAYGGSQKWYRSPRQKLAGCAPTSAANLAAYYQIGVYPDRMDGDVPVYEYASFLAVMKQTWKYLTPGMRGFPYLDKYHERFLKYARKYGVRLSFSECKEWDRAEEAAQFIRSSLERRDPVVMLILTHEAEELEDITWHWLTISGYDDMTGQVIVSNYGRRERYDSGLLFDPAEGNDVSMLSFHRQ
ncbi:MAG: C39 family peptidase [Firmicutes bacterium]|nr:C39 family peptidase [Bacillota bacterium]